MGHKIIKLQYKCFIWFQLKYKGKVDLSDFAIIIFKMYVYVCGCVWVCTPECWYPKRQEKSIVLGLGTELGSSAGKVHAVNG